MHGNSKFVQTHLLVLLFLPLEGQCARVVSVAPAQMWPSSSIFLSFQDSLFPQPGSSI